MSNDRHPHPADAHHLRRMELAAARLRPALQTLQSQAARGRLARPSLIRELLAQNERLTVLLRELRLRLREAPGPEQWEALEEAFAGLRRALARAGGPAERRVSERPATATRRLARLAG